MARLWTLVAALVGLAGGTATGYAINLRYGPRTQVIPDLPLMSLLVRPAPANTTSTEGKQTVVSVTRLKFSAARKDEGAKPLEAPIVMDLTPTEPEAKPTQTEAVTAESAPLETATAL